MAPATPAMQVTVAATTTRPRYHLRNRFASGKREVARTTKKPTTIGSSKALTICVQIVSQNQVRDRPDKCRSPEYARGVDVVEQWSAEWLNFRRSAVAGSLTDLPDTGQRGAHLTGPKGGGGDEE